ncbi:unnamed protein product [Ceratitis capitata]|uniref:(Mediterranean fruit fly) hypothetical protein n=1 Tax=Ceratitis capitata TaxID=7213 RepID=A0A811UA21_CERCA|nr:unnamed protein product [Ceratitis capitata]
MSKKVDYPELRAQLEALNNKELHHKCVEYGLIVPVADSTRDVIIRKLIKSITGTSNVSSPKINKKIASSPTDRRKTVNVVVHVSSDEDETGGQKQKTTTRNKARTQSPKGHNVSFDPKINNKQNNLSDKATRFDNNETVGVGLGNRSRIVPLEMTSGNITSNANTKANFAAYNVSASNFDSNQIRNINSTFAQEVPAGSYQQSTPKLGLSQTRILNTTYEQVDDNSMLQRIIPSPQEHAPNRTVDFYSARSPTNSFNIENMASHSSTIGSNFATASSPSKDTFFKRPAALSKSSVTNTSYNQSDAQRLYPRLPTDIITPQIYTPSPPPTPDSQKSSSSGRTPSLTKSGVMTTAYYQEIAPVKEVKHFEVESGEDLLEDASVNYSRKNTTSSGNYERPSYFSGINTGTAYTSSPLNRETYIAGNVGAETPPSPSLKRFSPISGTNKSYTRSIDEPDSCSSEGEELSAGEIYVQDSDEEEEYLAGTKKIYSSYGSNKIQERLPYRRSNTARLSSSPSPRYSQYSPERRSASPDNDDDDVNASLRNFLTTLDRKYHIKQMLYMFAIFVGAVFIYVVFIEKNPVTEDEDVLITSKIHS